MKLKYIIPIFILIAALVSCNKDDDKEDDFDAAAQALIDDGDLIAYLQSHYYIPPADGEVFGVIDTIMNNETPLFSQVEIQNVTENDISYKLYHYIENAGLNNAPTMTDSVLVNYRGFLLDSTKFDERLSYAWLSLTNVIRGWSHGFPKYKEGINVSESGEPLKFENSGKGVMFIPSGLAYGNNGSGTIAPNKVLLFFVDLGMVVRADHDNDGILSSIEDLDGDGNPNNDDTDGDLTPNYLDTDDDNDGVLTKNESATEDADNDGIVDYLDPDTK
tara:strand:- start:766558 stop:767382 length:825 start_codon:yes stop_codon:yes gene_type:complete